MLLSNVEGRVMVLSAVTAFGVYFCYLLLFPFIPSLTWAVALAVLAGPMHRMILKRIRKPNLAAGAAVVIIGFGIIVPSSFVGQNLAEETSKGVAALREQTQAEHWKETLANYPRLAGALGRVQRYVDVRGLAEGAANYLGSAVSTVVGGSIWILAQLFITLFTLFYLFRDRDIVLKKIRTLMPLTAEETDRIFSSVSSTVFATIYGTFSVALLQGVLGGLMFWWLGLPGPVLWGVVMALLALIPVLGAPIVWAPAALFLALSGSWVKAIILAAWGVIVIGVIDNLIYPILVGDKMRIHTLLIFFSVVGGLFLIGSSGLILGPVAVVATATLVEVLRGRVSGSEG